MFDVDKGTTNPGSFRCDDGALLCKFDSAGLVNRNGGSAPDDDCRKYFQFSNPKKEGDDIKSFEFGVKTASASAIVVDQLYVKGGSGSSGYCRATAPFAGSYRVLTGGLSNILVCFRKCTVETPGCPCTSTDPCYKPDGAVWTVDNGVKKCPTAYDGTSFCTIANGLDAQCATATCPLVAPGARSSSLCTKATKPPTQGCTPASGTPTECSPYKCGASTDAGKCVVTPLENTTACSSINLPADVSTAACTSRECRSGACELVPKYHTSAAPYTTANPVPANGGICRVKDVNNDCDAEDVCTAGSMACADGKAPTTTSCTPAAPATPAGPCGVDKCDGNGGCTVVVAKYNTGDTLPTAPCRVKSTNSADVCDKADYCVAGSAVCTDEIEPSSTVCRPRKNPCDAPDNCPGAGSEKAASKRCTADLCQSSTTPAACTTFTTNADVCASARRLF